MREDQGQQSVVIPLGIECDTDTGQLVQLLAPCFSAHTEALVFGSGRRVAKRRLERNQKLTSLVWCGDQSAEQMIRNGWRSGAVTLPGQGHNRSPRVYERPQVRERKQLPPRRIQQQDGRSFPDNEIVRGVHGCRFDARGREFAFHLLGYLEHDLGEVAQIRGRMYAFGERQQALQ